MVHELDAPDGGFADLWIAEIPDDEIDASIEVRDVGEITSRQIIDHPHPVPERDEPLDEV